MTSSASSATWLPAAIARTAVVSPTAPTRSQRGRHRAPEAPGTLTFATHEQLARTGRHAEQEWSRELFDPRRDEGARSAGSDIRERA
jgi:hypothetical protein